MKVVAKSDNFGVALKHRMTLRYLSALLLLGSSLFLYRCEDEDPVVPMTATGDMTVSVRNEFGQPISGALVYTDPTSQSGNTDEFGSVLLREIPVGSYEIFAEKATYGSGKAVAKVTDGELITVSISMVEGLTVGRAPYFQILFPTEPASYAPGDTIVFRAEVGDQDTPLTDLAVRWESDLDGLLYEAPPSAEGISTFSTSTLSSGQHLVTLTVTDGDGLANSGTISVRTDAPPAVTLLRADKVADGIALEWEPYTGGAFQVYRVYRSGPDCSESEKVLLAEIADAGEVTYLDMRSPFVSRSCYFVEVANTNGQFRRSNGLTVDDPAGSVFNFIPADMLLHPSASVVFLVDAGAQRIIRYNFDTGSAEGELSLPGEVGFCTVGDSGFGPEVYVPARDGWVYVYGADDLTLRTSINTGLPNSSVILDGKGHVIVAMQPSPWWEQPVRTYERATGINLDGNGDFDGDRLRRIPSEQAFMSISQSVSPIDMEYFELTDEGMISLHADDSYHGDHPLDPRIFRIAPTGEYAITSAEGAVYTANSSMEYRGSLQRGALLYSDFAFSPDGKTIYAGTQERTSIQIGSYPSLLRSDEILTRGAPVFLEYRDGSLICLSRTEGAEQTSGLEIIEVE